MSSVKNEFVAALNPSALRVEYLTDPLGLDVPQPRLSWVLGSAPELRGLLQTAYHVQVATGPEALVAGCADLWDSGEVASDATTFVSYGGRSLVSRQQCHWRVRVRDQRSCWSDWSRPGCWSMGPMRAGDWQARWIGTGESFADDPRQPTPDVVPLADNELRDPWLRRSITLSAAPTRATAFVASVGYHELYVNGHKVGDAVLMPAVTDNSKRARYVAYEIAPLLHAGENVLALWLGSGWSIFRNFETPDKPRAPIVLGQFEFDLPDGSNHRCVTDESWKWHPSPNRLLGAWYFMNFGGEEYDAAREIPGWASPGLDETGWKPAVCFSPALEVSAHVTEPNRRLTALSPARVDEPEPGVYRVDLGRNFSGCLEIALHGRPGDRVEIMVSEQADKPITHRLRSVYMIGPTGSGTFQNRFNYCAGRWLTIRGAGRQPEPAEVRAWMVRTDFAPASSFSSSHSLLNSIFSTTLWTLENLALGGYVVDCPHRERMGYGGDGHASLTTALTNYGFGAFCTKWAEDWRDVQGRASSWAHYLPPDQPGGGGREEGNIPYTAPTYWGGGGPSWSGFCIHLPWETYLRYGDVAILRRNLPTMGKWLAFLETKAVDGLLRPWGGEWDFLGDWLPPGGNSVNGQTDETLFFNNCYWVYGLRTAAAAALVVGESELADGWQKKARQLSEAIHAHFYQPAAGSYVDGSQASLAMALLAEVPPKEARAAVWRRLEREILEVRRGHIHAGITGGAMLFLFLMRARRDDLLHAMVEKQDYPGWGHMLAQGATTWWEAWGEHDSPSLLHSSYLYVGAWFVHGVLGIQSDPGNPGFGHFFIRPGVTNDPALERATGHYDSIRGRITVAWRRIGEQFELTVEVPANTTATVFVPVADQQIVEEGGLPLDETAMRRLGREEGREMIRVGSGRYRFSARSRSPAPPPGS